MKAKAINASKDLISFFPLFFLLEMVIQQKERAVFIQCNPFTVMTWEKRHSSQGVLHCSAIVGEKPEQGADN